MLFLRHNDSFWCPFQARRWEVRKPVMTFREYSSQRAAQCGLLPSLWSYEVISHVGGDLFQSVMLHSVPSKLLAVQCHLEERPATPLASCQQPFCDVRKYPLVVAICVWTTKTNYDM